MRSGGTIRVGARKLYPLASFQKAVADGADGTLRGFADGRRAYLLDFPEIKNLKK